MPSEQIPREAIAARLAEVGYVADRDLATALWMMDHLKRPLLIEGEAGVGKTEVAKALAALHGCELIRMQCYEGLDASSALYEWNYQRQLLAIKAREGGGSSASEIEAQIFSEDYLLERPLLSAIRRKTSPGAAGRRGRPRRRGIRGVPARVVVGLPGHDPRIRHDYGAFDPARRADLQRHPRTVGRAAPPLPLSLSRFSGRRSRSGDPAQPPTQPRREFRLPDRAHGRNVAQGRPEESSGRRRNPRLGGHPRRPRCHGPA